MLRCFVALRVDDATCRAVARLQEKLQRLPKNAARRVRMTKGKNLHLTIKFLGETDTALLPDLTEGLRQAASAQPCEAADLAGLGAFPSETRPRALFCKVDRGRQSMIELAERVESVCEQLGFPREQRARHPHVTIARIERATPGGALSELIAHHSATRFGAVETGTLVLFSSTLTPDGSIYEPLAELALPQR